MVTHECLPEVENMTKRLSYISEAFSSTKETVSLAYSWHWITSMQATCQLFHCSRAHRKIASD